MSGLGTDIQWFIARDGKQHGPVSDIELKKLIELSHLKPGDLLWRQGFSDWRTAASVFPALAERVPAGAAAPAPAGGSPASGPIQAAVGTLTTGRPAGGAPAPAQGAAGSPQAAQPLKPFVPGPAPEPRPAAGEARGDTTLQTRPLGNAPARPGGPFPAPGAGSTALALAPRAPSPAELAAAPRPKAAAGGGRRKALLVALGLLAMTGAGAWLSSQYKDQILAVVQTQSPAGSAAETGAITANVMPPSGAEAPPTATPAALAAPTAPSAEEIDRKMQGRTLWVAVKQEFPDWYQARVAEVARLSAEKKDQIEITRYLVGELVALRRENAKHALAASTPRHKELAAAFLANLKQLSLESGDGCYDFISKGEQSPTIVARMDDPAKSAEIETQMVAIVAAIGEGKRQPAEHAAPVKTDYDVLAGELGRLGWTQADMQLFANPKELAKAPRARVCNMLKDWFTAHLAIQDPSTQERLLFETLKPVISG